MVMNSANEHAQSINETSKYVDENSQFVVRTVQVRPLQATDEDEMKQQHSRHLQDSDDEAAESGTETYKPYK